MRNIDFYVIGLFGLDTYIIFRIIPFAQSEISAKNLPGKQLIVLASEALMAVSVCLLFQALAKILSVFQTNDVAEQKKIVLSVAKNTIYAFSLFFILSMLQGFVLF